MGVWVSRGALWPKRANFVRSPPSGTGRPSLSCSMAPAFRVGCPVKPPLFRGFSGGGFARAAGRMRLMVATTRFELLCRCLLSGTFAGLPKPDAGGRDGGVWRVARRPPFRKRAACAVATLGLRS